MGLTRVTVEVRDLAKSRKPYENEFLVDREFAFKKINHIFEKMLAIARNESFYESFPTVKEFLHSDKEFSACTQDEKNIFETVFALLESGVIPDKYINIIQKLSKCFKIGVISNIWSESSYFRNYYKRYGIMDCFSTTVFSSDYGIIKPSVKLFDIALSFFNIKKEKIAYAGNNYKRDVVGAKNAGLTSILIDNGSASKITGDIKPDMTVNDLGEIFDI